MRVGIIGTGAISWTHAEAYRNIGYPLTACSSSDPERGREFAARYGCQLYERWQDVCVDPDVDFVDVCTFPNFRLQPVALCAASGKHVQMQKPIATDVETARRMLELAHSAGITLGVVSQHRFDDSIRFLKPAIDAGRLGQIIQADAYVKWFRTPEYYAPEVKGTWEAEG